MCADVPGCEHVEGNIGAAFESVMDSGYRGVQPPAATPPANAILRDAAERIIAADDESLAVIHAMQNQTYVGQTFKFQIHDDNPETVTVEKRVTNATTGGEKGQKDAQFSLLPWDVLGKLAEHYAKGAKKYSRNNWRKGYDWSLSVDALGRHLAAFIEGETYDPETGSHHMLAVMFHAASLVYFTDAHPELDDRRNSVAHNPTE